MSPGRQKFTAVAAIVAVFVAHVACVCHAARADVRPVERHVTRGREVRHHIVERDRLFGQADAARLDPRHVKDVVDD